MQDLTFSPDGSLLAAGGLDGVILREMATGQTRRLTGHSQPVLSLAFSPDGMRLASGSFDETVVIWDLPAGKILNTLPGHSMGAAGLVFSADGSWLVSGDQQDKIRGWRVENGDLLKTIEGRGQDLALSPDTLASRGTGGALLAFKPTIDDVALWDVAAGREVYRQAGERPLAFSPDGRLLVVGAYDGLIRLWGVKIASSPIPSPTQTSGTASTLPVALVARYTIPEANAVAVSGSVAYITSEAGLHVLDITEPTQPHATGFYEAQGAGEVTVMGNIAYVLVGGILHLVDVSDPSALTQVGLYELPFRFVGLAVADQNTYLGAGVEGFVTLDVSDPAALREISRVPGEAGKVAVAGAVAYVVEQVVGVHLIDISNPAGPRQAGFYPWVDPITDLAVAPSPVNPAATLLYLGTLGQGLRILDVSDPSAPREIGAYATRGSAYSVAVVRNRVYVANGWGASGLSILDVSDPTSPYEVAFYPAETEWDSLVDVAALATSESVDILVADRYRFEGVLILKH
jgi:hypothetical protein